MVLFCLFSFFVVVDKFVELVGGGYFNNGASLSSFTNEERVSY